MQAQLCPSVQPHGHSPPGSSVHGILQARILEWEAIPFSRGSSWPRDWTCISCTAGRFSTSWARWEAPNKWTKVTNWSSLRLSSVADTKMGHPDPCPMKQLWPQLLGMLLADSLQLPGLQMLPQMQGATLCKVSPLLRVAHSPVEVQGPGLWPSLGELWRTLLTPELHWEVTKVAAGPTQWLHFSH